MCPRITRLEAMTSVECPNAEGMTKHECSDQSDDSLWFEERAPFIREEPDTTPVYDLEERTARFGEAIIRFAKKIPLGPLTDRIINQLVGAGTSVGANYDDADDAVSKKDWHVQERSA
jgi:hypothetical protein